MSIFPLYTGDVTSELTEVERQVRIFSSLADPLRYRFVRELADGGETCGKDMAEKLGISLALLCHHSKQLIDSGVVKKRKDAQTSWYSLNRPVLEDGVRELLRDGVR